ncbi:hypothetical protein ACFQZ4_03185 [Catellatospora coxensis]
MARRHRASLADAVKAVELIAAGGTPALPKSGLSAAAGRRRIRCSGRH